MDSREVAYVPEITSMSSVCILYKVMMCSGEIRMFSKMKFHMCIWEWVFLK